LPLKKRGAQMAQPVVHYPRLAWDGALVLVRVLESDLVLRWFSEPFDLLAGPGSTRALFESGDRLWFGDRLDARQAEAGLWRVRLEELLYTRPELTAPLRQLFDEAAARLARPPLN
jgi:hypothetical protein